MTEYIRNLNRLHFEKKQRDNIVFGQLGGLILVLLGVVRWYADANNEYRLLHLFVISSGIILIALGFLLPDAVSPVYKIFSYIGNKIGSIVFALVLSFIYFFVVAPISYFVKKRQNEYLLMKWEDEYPGSEEYGFTSWNPIGGIVHNSFAGSIFRIIGIFAGSGQAIIIPVVLLLVILGVILFFVSSSVMAPFIYTLF